MRDNLKAGRKKLQKEMETGVRNSKRNNTNSVSRNNSSVINISSSNNKFCVGRRRNNK
jgi:hypothetical protein